ncbi:ATP synthase subunit delta [Candidatus Hepatincolaceae symbiont of Richtersius coronifer]
MQISQERSIKKYSQALLDLAIQRNLETKLAADMLKLKGFFTELKTNQVAANSSLSYSKRLLALSKKNQLEIMSNIIQNFRLEALVKNLIILLINNNQLQILDYIATYWEEIYLEYKGFIKVKAVSAVPLNEDQLSRIKKIIRSKIGNNFYLIQEINDEILGGLILYLQNQAYDDSLKSKLYRITNSIKG